MAREGRLKFEAAVDKLDAEYRRDGRVKRMFERHREVAWYRFLFLVLEHYDQSHLARHLGLHRNTLRNRLRSVTAGTARARPGRPRSIQDPRMVVFIEALRRGGTSTRTIAALVKKSPSAIERVLLEEALRQRVARSSRENMDRIEAFIQEVADWLRRRGTNTDNTFRLDVHLEPRPHTGTDYLSFHEHAPICNAHRVAVRAAYFFPPAVVRQAMSEVDARYGVGGSPRRVATVLWRFLRRKAAELGIDLDPDPSPLPPLRAVRAAGGTLSVEALGPWPSEADLESFAAYTAGPGYPLMPCGCTRNIGTPSPRSLRVPRLT